MSEQFNQGRSVLQAGGGNEYYEEVSENENDNQESLEEIFNKKIQEIKIKGGKYVDEDFSHSAEESLIPDKTDQSKFVQDKVEEWARVKWLRIDKIPYLNREEDGPMEIFKDSLSGGDIIQGKVNDSYFLSVLSAIAENPDRIKGMFLS